ncbi:MAG TPA: substrate-binding domain-containing protein, partial [Spirochaetia bacterium]|nr:substrate-binding domain-containing protein [Spirochaetia bacterium]
KPFGLGVPAVGVPAPNSDWLGYAAMNTILDAGKPDAVVATDDLLAFGVLRAADERGFTDIAVAGFNNSVRAAYQRPALTSVEIRPEELGYQAAHLLIASLAGDPQASNHRVIETSVIHRDITLLRRRR